MVRVGVRSAVCSVAVLPSCFCWSAVACVTTADQTPAASPTTRPSAQSRPTAFQPGVEIDWSAPAVRVAGQVATRSGGLEFLACFHTREHESAIRLHAAATHMYMAMGLIGISSGHPPKWNEKTHAFDPAAGDLVDISVEWTAGGELRSADAFAWMLDAKYGRSIAPRPWIFAGSLRMPDGGLEADLSGRAIALVDFPENLLTLSRAHVSADADLWATAATREIPPTGTKVQVVIRPAKPRAHTVLIDFRGDLRLDGGYITMTDFADIVMLQRQLAPPTVQEIAVDRALASDVRRVRTALQTLGVKPDAITFVTLRPSAVDP